MTFQSSWGQEESPLQYNLACSSNKPPSLGYQSGNTNLIEITLVLHQ